MKKILFLILLLFTVKGFSQSVADLERNPSFKGITIGAPISRYSDILTFSHTAKGKNVYRVYHSRYLSIFNVSMQDMTVVESGGKVYAILLTKTYPSDSGGATMFNTNDLLSWQTSLSAKYVNNFINLDDMSGTPAVCGTRWQATSVVLDIVYLFYGTFGKENPRLIYYLYVRNDDY